MSSDGSFLLAEHDDGPDRDGSPTGRSVGLVPVDQLIPADTTEEVISFIMRYVGLSSRRIVVWV